MRQSRASIALCVELPGVKTFYSRVTHVSGQIIGTSSSCPDFVRLFLVNPDTVSVTRHADTHAELHDSDLAGKGFLVDFSYSGQKIGINYIRCSENYIFSL